MTHGAALKYRFCGPPELVVPAGPRAERRNNLRPWRCCCADWARRNNLSCTGSPRTRNTRQVGRSGESRVWTRNLLQQSPKACCARRSQLLPPLITAITFELGLHTTSNYGATKWSHINFLLDIILCFAIESNRFF